MQLSLIQLLFIIYIILGFTYSPSKRQPSAPLTPGSPLEPEKILFHPFPPFPPLPTTPSLFLGQIILQQESRLFVDYKIQVKPDQAAKYAFPPLPPLPPFLLLGRVQQDSLQLPPSPPSSPSQLLPPTDIIVRFYNPIYSQAIIIIFPPGLPLEPLFPFFPSVPPPFLDCHFPLSAFPDLPFPFSPDKSISNSLLKFIIGATNIIFPPQFFIDFIGFSKPLFSLTFISLVAQITQKFCSLQLRK
eukprot:TRINITY_DN30446_c0_g1_i1.p1 TRINITY_DN30446_c0_g1~~TRINITY_DN30446_c0_g1_i1.p1  ORF type:complete len:244 (+),score=-7.19 TRINITY_DN30446_c0_g1_i1:250-981(+)